MYCPSSNMSFALGVTDVASARAGTRQLGQEQRFVMEKIAQVVVGIARWEWPQNWPSLSGLYRHISNLTASPLLNALCPYIFYHQVVCLYFDDLVPSPQSPHISPLPSPCPRMLFIGDLRSLATNSGDVQRYMTLLVWRGLADDTAAADIPGPARTRILKGLQGEQVFFAVGRERKEWGGIVISYM